jgi:hypothetical protein
VRRPPVAAGAGADAPAGAAPAAEPHCVRQHMISRFTVGLASCAVVAGCGEYTGPCTLTIDPAIVVAIRHANTGAPLADSATGVVIDGAYSDSLRLSGGNGAWLTRRAADERPGVYTVFVSRPGFRNWSTSGVRARGGDCHVRTVWLDAALVPLP